MTLDRRSFLTRSAATAGTLAAMSGPTLADKPITPPGRVIAAVVRVVRAEGVHFEDDVHAGGERAGAAGPLSGQRLALVRVVHEPDGDALRCQAAQGGERADHAVGVRLHAGRHERGHRVDHEQTAAVGAENRCRVIDQSLPVGVRRLARETAG